MALKQTLSIQSTSIEAQQKALGSEKMVCCTINDELNLESSKPTKHPEQDQEDILESIEQSAVVQKSNQWSSEEIRTLFALFKELGSRWTAIAKMIPNKSENAIKNKFNCCMRKFTRKLNKINKESYTKFRKQIRTESVFRIIEAAQLFPNMQIGMKMKSLQIRERILIEARKQEENEENENIIDLINDINNFNLKTRSHKNPKHKRRKDIILFEPSKEFQDSCQISYDKIFPKVVNLRDQVSDDKVGPSPQKCTEINPQSQSTDLSLFLSDFENADNSFVLPINDSLIREERENCFWSNILNDEKYEIMDQNLWFEN